MYRFPRRFDYTSNADWKNDYEEAEMRFEIFVNTHDVVKLNTFRRPSTGTLMAAEIFYRWEDKEEEH